MPNFLHIDDIVPTLFLLPCEPEIIKILFLNKLGSAFLKPLFSVPAIGCPPTKDIFFRCFFAKDITLSLILATSEGPKSALSA